MPSPLIDTTPFDSALRKTVFRVICSAHAFIASSFLVMAFALVCLPPMPWWDGVDVNMLFFLLLCNEWYWLVERVWLLRWTCATKLFFDSSHRRILHIIVCFMLLWREIIILWRITMAVLRMVESIDVFLQLFFNEGLIHWYHLADTNFFGWNWRYQLWYIWTAETWRNVKINCQDCSNPEYDTKAVSKFGG